MTEFVRILDFQDGSLVVYHYEIISSTHNINLIGRTVCYKLDRPPFGNIASGPTRYAGTVRGLLRTQVSDFLCGKVRKND